MRKSYKLGMLINFLKLLAGMTIGFLLGTWYADNSPTVLAQSSQNFEEITPTMTVGSAGIGTVLAGRIAADQMMVQGFDVLKLQEATLNLLKNKGYASLAELESVANQAKVQRPLRMKQPPTQTQEPKKEESK